MIRDSEVVQWILGCCVRIGERLGTPLIGFDGTPELEASFRHIDERNRPSWPEIAPWLMAEDAADEMDFRMHSEDVERLVRKYCESPEEFEALLQQVESSQG